MRHYGGCPEAARKSLEQEPIRLDFLDKVLVA
jgi:hypothetical protein